MKRGTGPIILFSGFNGKYGPRKCPSKRRRHILCGCVFVSSNPLKLSKRDTTRKMDRFGIPLQVMHAGFKVDGTILFMWVRGGD